MKKPETSEMCPPGCHVVRGHERICHSGTKSWVDTHMRRSRERRQIFRKENILFLHFLSGHPDKKGYREMKSDYVFISRDSLEDPVVSIAAGTRWLFYKYSQIPKGEKKNIFNVIKNYHSWNKDGEDYAHRIMEIYKNSK